MLQSMMPLQVRRALPRPFAGLSILDMLFTNIESGFAHCPPPFAMRASTLQRLLRRQVTPVDGNRLRSQLLPAHRLHRPRVRLRPLALLRRLHLQALQSRARQETAPAINYVAMLILVLSHRAPLRRAPWVPGRWSRRRSWDLRCAVRGSGPSASLVLQRLQTQVHRLPARRLPRAIGCRPRHLLKDKLPRVLINMLLLFVFPAVQWRWAWLHQR